jgi:putative FmdB family regulatory protein
MPIYEFKCSVCQISIEVEKSMHEESQPLCCGQNMSRTYSTFGLQFKGKGWGKDA